MTVADFELAEVYANFVQDLEQYLEERKKGVAISEPPERIRARLQLHLRHSAAEMSSAEATWWDDLLVEVELEPFDGLPGRKDWSSRYGPKKMATKILTEYLENFEPKWKANWRYHGHRGRDAIENALRVCETAQQAVAKPEPSSEDIAIAHGFEPTERGDGPETLSLMATLCGQYVPALRHALRRIQRHAPDRKYTTVVPKSEYLSAMDPLAGPEEIRVLENGRAVACHRHCDIEYPALVALQADYGIGLSSDGAPKRSRTRAVRSSNLKRHK